MSYEKFIDADQNRVAWVAVFRRFEELIRELDEIAPKVAIRWRTRFYEEAAQPLVTARHGEELLEWLDSELGSLWPLSWEEAVRCSEETGLSAFEVADEHRQWALAQE